MAGRCWGLFLLPAAAAQLTATDFVPYYDYDGDLAVAGTVTVTTDGTSQTLDYSLTGTDVGCAAGADSDTANSCGVHVHQGTTCTDDAGSHWYDDEEITEDPWATVGYSGAGTVSDTVDVDTGLTAADLVGRALIIHGYDGGRIACALLTAPASSAPTPEPVVVDWDLGMDPQTLSVAAGTTVTFSWTGGHNVYAMPDETDFNNCDFGSSTNLGSTSGVSVDPADGSTKYYGCEVGSHCIMGQKIAITWEAASTAAPVVAPTAAPTPRPSVAATLAPTNSSAVAPTPTPTTTAPAPTNASAPPTPAPVASAQTSASPTPAETPNPTDVAAPVPAPTSGEFSGPAPTINPTPAPTAESVVIASQLVLAEVPDDMEAATLEIVVKNALVATLTSVTSTDQIVAFSVVSSRRRRLQQSTTTVAFSVRVEGSAEFAASYAETIVSDLSTAAQSGALTTALATAANAEGAVGPTAPAAANDYDTIMAATGGFPTPQPTLAPSRRPTPRPSRRPTPRPTAATAGMEEEDGSEDQGEDQGEDESEDKGADSAGGGLAVLGIALAAFLGLLCVGGYVRMKMFGSQDRSDRDWARDLHGSGVTNPAAARDPWGRPTPSETRGVEMATTHGFRSYH
jgi:plastocyanin